MNKIIIIGASSGLGQRIATDFARMGFRVGIAARRSDHLEAIRTLYPQQIVTKTIDVTLPDAVERFQQLIELNTGMDTLLYAAGCGLSDPQLADDAALHHTLDVNVTGFARITAAAYRYFRNRTSPTPARIAAITSVAAVKGIGTMAAYSASKRFEQQFLNAIEQLAYNQRVNLRITDIRPGFIRTPLLDDNKQYPMEMSIDYAAPLIEHAILKGSRRAWIDTRWLILSGLWSLLPQRLWRHLNVTSLLGK